MNILITGGTGFIGSELRPMLLRRGDYLTIITRNRQAYQDEEAKNQKFIAWNSPLVEVMEWADAVINLAGESIFGRRWNEKVKKRIYHSRVDNTKKLADAAKEADNPPEVMVSASAVGYYGNRGMQVLDEGEPPGDDFLADVCAVWEHAARPVKDAGVRLATPRMGIVLEKGGGVLQQMLTPFKLYVGGPVGRGTQYVPWIHRYDLCRGLIYPLEKKHFEGPYNLTAPNPVTMDEFTGAVGDVLNRPSYFRIPEFLLKKILGEAAIPILASIRAEPAHLLQDGFEFQFKQINEALGNIL